MDQAADKTVGQPESSDATSKSYCFGEYTFDSELLELSKSGEAIALKMQPARLLKLLLESAPDTLTRRTLQEKIWDNGTTVEFEQGLNVCVNQLRMALDDSASNPTYIATLPKRGYRFVAPVEIVSQAISRSRYGLAGGLAAIIAIVFGVAWYAYSDAGTTVQSRIYVSPVEFVDAAPDTPASLIQYGLRLGVVDQLIRGAGNDVLTVNGETLWADEQLLRLDAKTDYRLAVKITVDNGEYRANVLLLKEGEDEASAAQSFDIGALKAENLSRVSLQIARWASVFLGSTMSAVEPPPFSQDPNYYDAIVKAKRAFKAGNLSMVKGSLEWGQKALAISPNSSEAKGIVAVTLAVLAGNHSDYPARETIARALSYADEIRNAVGATVESELARGYIAQYYYRDLHKAEEAFDLALELAPGNALVHSWRAGMHAVKGEVSYAAMEADIAMKLDPLSVMVATDHCWFLRAAKRNQEAVNACAWLNEQVPNDFVFAIWLAFSLEAAGRELDAAQILDELLNKARSMPDAPSLPDDAVANRKLTALQMQYCEIAWRMDALPEEYGFAHYIVASVWGRCGEYERSAEALRQAKTKDEMWPLFYHIDPAFDGFRASAKASTVDMSFKVRGSE